jgi:ferredoxin-NADP reductase
MRAMFYEFQKRAARATLLYSVRAPSEAAFLPELRAAAAASNGTLKVVLTVTGKGNAAWAGRRGRIDRGLIAEQVRACCHHSYAPALCLAVPVCLPSGTSFLPL